MVQWRGWSGGAMVLGKLPVPGRPTIWITVGQGPTALAVGAGGGCLDIFTLVYPFSPLSPSLRETARYGLKYCLKGPLNPKQPTNGAMVLGKPPVPGLPTNLDYSRARAYCACSRGGWALFGHFVSHLSFLSSFSFSLGDGPIKTEILSQRAVKPQTTNQPIQNYQLHTDAICQWHIPVIEAPKHFLLI